MIFIFSTLFIISCITGFIWYILKRKSNKNAVKDSKSEIDKIGRNN